MKVEITLGGQLRTIRFNNYQKEALGRLYGTDPLESSKVMIEKWGGSNIRMAADLIYTGLIGAYEVKMKDRDFSREDVAEWVGDASDKDLAAVIQGWTETEEVRSLIKAMNGASTDAEAKKKPHGRKLKTSPSAN